jgi:hypothetical protein
MTVNLRMLRRIDQGEEVEAADGAVSPPIGVTSLAKKGAVEILRP